MGHGADGASHALWKAGAAAPTDVSGPERLSYSTGYRDAHEVHDHLYRGARVCGVQADACGMHRGRWHTQEKQWEHGAQIDAYDHNCDKRAADHHSVHHGVVEDEHSEDSSGQHGNSDAHCHRRLAFEVGCFLGPCQVPSCECANDQHRRLISRVATRAHKHGEKVHELGMPRQQTIVR
eukprot:764737-Prymnesium_polylepis.1